MSINRNHKGQIESIKIGPVIIKMKFTHLVIFLVLMTILVLVYFTSFSYIDGKFTFGKDKGKLILTDKLHTEN